MDAKERREDLLKRLMESKEPLSGTTLAKRYDVTRQVIVQDIAVLKAAHKNILPTAKGYLYFEAEPKKATRAFHVKHSTDEIAEEFYTIVDLGGAVLDVYVKHEVYGRIATELVVRNRKDAAEFIRSMKENHTSCLKELTDGEHYHTVEADSEECLNEIEKALKEKGFLLME